MYLPLICHSSLYENILDIERYFSVHVNKGLIEQGVENKKMKQGPHQWEVIKEK